jgi:hypothetical protein
VHFIEWGAVYAIAAGRVDLQYGRDFLFIVIL